jgi:hypothetical protein
MQVNSPFLASSSRQFTSEDNNGYFHELRFICLTWADGSLLNQTPWPFCSNKVAILPQFYRKNRGETPGRTV